MRKFIFKTTILSLPILILLLLVNYYGDEASLFNNRYEKQMATIIASGNNVTNFNNYNERLFQQEIISNECIKPNLVVIGSSRTMLINTSFFPGYTLFNNSVAGASLEDIISIYQLYKNHNKLPQKIVIGIDPWLFNENNGQNSWQTYAAYYYKFLGLKNQKHFSYSKYKQLLSISYFQSSFSKFKKTLKGNSMPLPTKEKYNVSFTKLTDGSLVYSERHRNFSSIEIENRINSYVEGGIYSVEFFTAISDRLWKEFNQLIADMNKNNIEIEFILVPYAPFVYKTIEKDYPMIIATEEMIKDFAKANGIKFHGSFNPNTLGMNESSFYDGMHCNATGIEEIILNN
ncbi:MAG: hypothetical protein ACERKD_06565 [Prolixibacteraceae bacterium]